MLRNETHFGMPRSRVDGPAKVKGEATYAAEFNVPGLLYGYVVSSTVARGKLTRIDADAAEAVPGVVKVYTHENRPRTAWFDYKYRDQVAPPGSPFRPLYDETVYYSGQPIALVVAENFEAARFAASLVAAEYEEEAHRTDIKLARPDAYEPPKKRSGIQGPPKSHGDAMGAYASAPKRIAGEYTLSNEFHNPMEPHATTAVFEGPGKLKVHDKIQGVMNTQAYVSAVFGLSKEDVHVVSPFVGGGFGSGLRPQYQLFLAVMAALDLERSVRVELTRDQMFTFTHRPATVNTVMLGADETGRLQALRHDAIGETSRFEDYQEVVVNWSGLLYSCENKQFGYKLAQVDTYTPGDMRAPGAPTGLFATESAVDELAYELNMDPIDLRLRNYTAKDETANKEFTSKELRACYRAGAERFGWTKRNPVPRSMREGRELTGWGMASGMWEAQLSKTSARARLSRDGRLEVATATADIGTGTYTILTQIGADAFGLDMESVTARIADSTLPASPVEGGSWTAASAGSAVQLACVALKEKLLKQAKKMDGSPFSGAKLDDLHFAHRRMALAADVAKSIELSAVVAASGEEHIEAEETASPNPLVLAQYSSFAHSAVFVEVRVDEELGQVRVTRVVDAVAAGRIINPKTARSQIIGGVVWGISEALHEEALTDHRLGRIMNHNLAEYHVAVNADVRDIEVIFVEEHDDKTSPIGVKGLGEIGIVGTAAAIANAVYHATGKRIRSLPITIDKVLDAAA